MELQQNLRHCSVAIKCALKFLEFFFYKNKFSEKCKTLFRAAAADELELIFFSFFARSLFFLLVCASARSEEQTKALEGLNIS